MIRPKIIKILLKKFKWNFVFLFSLCFFVSYFSFLIPFNFRNNLSYAQEKRGWFYYLFGKYLVIKSTQGSGEVYVDWNKLLLFLFLLHFPLKIFAQSALNYFQEFSQRKVIVYLTKKFLNFAYKNKDWVMKKADEKVYIITNSIPNFSRHFFDVTIELFSFFIDISLNLFWFFFLIDSRQLSHLLPLSFVFIFTNLLWLIIFHLFTNKFRQSQGEKKIEYQYSEKDQIKIFLNDLNDKNNSVSLSIMHKSLDKNSQKLSSLNFISLLLNSPNLIIPGFSVLFLYLYYNFFLEGQGGLSWNDYFLAYSIQSIFLTIKKLFNLLPTISSLQKNYHQVERFFD